ncbi:LysR family transcriptional regulator [Nocardia asteroides NBRC 15531]|nr:LysR family transcriptional regulator [Nocardia asteroides]TLF64587.1 LysR family transcriptional regulator [Nocardia asteroides NBRC 15531]UGT50300.1 LysR family transcriptional regulator [Nocardia asteroides]SFN12926.1 DNA-binding transcriptional regulator, LysR family [Nocardia asteroides]VEG36915.1 HTH-type transcriptional activator AllS [Nocardia asteroides]
MRHRTADGSMDLVQLRTFLAVHRTGSLTAGAAQVGLSQPTVTTQVQALERHLGTPLFERLPRGVAPTAAGHELAARVSGPLDALEAVIGGPGPDRPVPPEPPVLLGGPAEQLAVQVLPALAPLVADGVRLVVRTGLTDELLAGLRSGTMDLVIATARPRGRTVLAEPLADEEFVLVAAPAVAERIDSGLLAADGPGALRGLAIVSYAADLPILRRYWRHVFETRLETAPALIVPDLRAVLAAVAAGAGISVLPRYLCARELAEGILVPLLDPADPPINTGFLARRVGAPPRPHVDLVRARLLAAARTWRAG